MSTVWRSLGGASARLLALVAFVVLLVTPASAAGGESVALEFQGSDYIYLWISFGFGIIALITTFLLRNFVMRQSPGDEKMQEVGKAIEDGARAYLVQQIKMMSIFIVVLAAMLFALYATSYDATLALLVVGSFVAGVAASYIAGYVGMLVAVAANMRTAAAAMESYGRALTVAFRSGGVAGLITVGMGLLGATIIFLFFPTDATKLLVGFGFGGSLAALFMRVGGGIFTKAADVGADLVGKVEAGIPEDDPRNPAVIADNVGDNVGDCAGMAADIFESYAVTLVAAIVLGAATSAIFDTPTWMRLILFALMARGVGILASVLGIYMVKGKDDLDADPLVAIGKGFKASAAISAVAIAGLAFVMMGGIGTVGGQFSDQDQFEQRGVLQSLLEILYGEDYIEEFYIMRDRFDELFGGSVRTVNIQTRDQQVLSQFQTFFDVRDRIANERGVNFDEVTDAEFAAAPEIAALGLDDQTRDQLANQVRTQRVPGLPVLPALTGFEPIRWDDEENPVLGYAVSNPASFGDYQTLAETYGGVNLSIIEIQLRETPPAPEGMDPGFPLELLEPREESVVLGPVTEAEVSEFRAQLRMEAERSDGSFSFDISRELPVVLYSNRDGDVVAVVDGEGVDLAQVQSQGGDIRFYRMSPERVAEREEAAFAAENPAPMPSAEVISLATRTGQNVPWWTFAVCVIFGIIMAFLFERLTDYYVSFKKKPVREVAEVGTAGPAPMIIQGFAYGKESSVFSLLAIVACLIVPIVIFNPAVYGGYLLSFYGIALVGLGLLTTTGYILAMDTFGPISDNAQGVFEMAGKTEAHPDAALGLQRLDAAGNTTKALTKGFAIATAVVAAVALFHSYVEEAFLTGVGMSLDVPEIFFGLLIGGAAPYLFSAFSLNAVGRSAFELIEEVRRQFREDPGIMEGTSKPNYGRCVEIVTAAAQRELLSPGILAIALPVAVGFGFSIGKESTIVFGQVVNLTGAQALGGFLAGTILSGQLMAVLLANSGGMWDNAKKLIEDGLHGGKGTEAHKAAVVCDTVGDPFKDTSGPAMNPLIKVMNLVALLMAPVIIQPLGNPTLIIITTLAVAALVVSFWWSKRGSLAQGMASVAEEAQRIEEAAGEPASVVAEPESVIEDKPADNDKQE